MTTHQYLTSGILESYLLGLVSEQQKADVELLLASDQEIQAQLSELEVEMEQYFLTNGVPPPPAVRSAVLERISETGIQKREEYVHSTEEAPQPEPAKSGYIDVEVNDTHIRVHKHWRPAFIAVFILSKIFLILGLYYYFKSGSLEQEINRLKADTRQAAPSVQYRTR